jgi:hypothetical protein
MRIWACGLSLLICSLLGVRQAQALVHIDVDLLRQRMTVTSASGAQYSWPVSSGRAGHLTPRGVFRPQRMMAMTYSIPYEMAPMPHAIFFTGGYAIHGTYSIGQLGRPASHGCVRLAPGNAATLFALVKREGARIAIFGTEPANAPRWGARLARMTGRRLRPRPSPAAYGMQPQAWQLRPWVGD